MRGGGGWEEKEDAMRRMQGEGGCDEEDARRRRMQGGGCKEEEDARRRRIRLLFFWIKFLKSCFCGRE